MKKDIRSYPNLSLITLPRVLVNLLLVLVVVVISDSLIGCPPRT
jgi:hypothetical protein